MDSPVRRSVRVRATPERAFEAFVSVPEVLSWLADGAVIGARPGGGWGVGWFRDPSSDAGTTLRGTLSVFEPGKRLVVAEAVFSTADDEEFGPLTLRVDFHARDGGTEVVLVQEGRSPAPGWEAHGIPVPDAWEIHLRQLRLWLDEGKKLPGR